MSGQLKVGYQTTAAAAKLFRSLWCNFIYRNFTLIMHPCQLSHFRSKLHSCRYETYDHIAVLLVFSEQEINVEKKSQESKISSHQFKIKSPQR